MPKVNGVHYPYTAEGYKAARKARKKKSSNKNYHGDAVKLARAMTR